MGITNVLKKYPTTFWVANMMELFERWAWYGFYIIFALYLTNSTDEGALGFSQTQKGLIMGIGTAFLYLLPILTGALSDRIGYRKTLFFAYTIYTIVFLLIPIFKSYVTVFAIYLLLAIGAALFKPIIAATVTKTTDEESSSIGFGIFYMMVNIGAFIGPFVTGFVRKYSWDYVFYSSAAVIAVNFILVAFFYKDPIQKIATDKPSFTVKQQVSIIFGNIWKALSDWRFSLFLIIVSGFWTMYLQFYMSLPVFIDQWVNTAIVYDFLVSYWPWLAHQLGTANGTIPAEYIMNVDAGYIILFQIAISYIAMRYKPLSAMIAGILIASVGLGLSLSTQNGLFIIVALLIFSIGEMSSSPKITEYIGRIAPPDKTALYIGCSYIPLALGNIFAGIVSGNVYQNLSDKITLTQKEIIARGIDLPAIGEQFTKNDYFRNAATKMQMSNNQLTQFLWDKYHPSSFWFVVLGIGVSASAILFLYDQFIIKKR
ncbi:MAG: MFS transporter [Bacteroidia bacterium]|nr:MFS transporter [Bacteroidia bacterium]